MLPFPSDQCVQVPNKQVLVTKKGFSKAQRACEKAARNMTRSKGGGDSGPVNSTNCCTSPPAALEISSANPVLTNLFSVSAPTAGKTQGRIALASLQATCSCNT